MDPFSTSALKKEKLTKSVEQLFAHVKGLVTMSREARASYFGDWDQADATYRGLRVQDQTDVKAESRGQPGKMVVPLSFAQVQTFVSFVFLLVTQNRTMFELTPTGNEDFGTRPDSELVLERDVKKNQFNLRLYQWLLDVARFGHGIMEVGWVEEYYRSMEVVEGEAGNFLGIEVSGGVSEIENKILQFEGNRVTNISPYRFFPDTRLPLSRFQEGEFCATEDEYAFTYLKRLESDGVIAGLEHVPKMSVETWKSRGGSRLPYMEKELGGTRTEQKSGSPLMASNSVGSAQTSGTLVVTKVQVDIVPSEFEIEEGKKLGRETWPVRYLVWYANDARPIRIEPLNAMHGQFTYGVGEFTPDMHKLVNQGLSELIDKLQSVITWYINSHITAVRRVINNRVVVDPAGIEMKSLEDPDSPFILLKRDASRQGVAHWIEQLKLQDTTTGHMADSDMLMKLMQVVTGINDNAQGQYNSGRRSATEARAVTAGAAGRLKTHASILYEGGLAPTGRMMLTNSRQGMSLETFQRIIGRGLPPEELNKRFTAFKGTIEDLVGGDDFFVFDGTLQSEKGFIAQSLQELLTAIISNPIAAQVLDLDPRAVFKEIQYLRGVTNVDRFVLSANVKAGQPPLPPIPPPSAPAIP